MTPELSFQTQLCISLAGRPGSFGTRFHNHLFQALELDYLYKAFTTTDLPAAIGGVRALGIRGCAVSMPFKEACVPLVDELDPSAAAIGSVNTIVNTRGRLCAYNTDYLAVAALIRSHGVPADVPVLLRGSGGMARAVAAALRDAGFREGVIVARNRERGEALAQEIGWRWQLEPPSTAGALLVNVTPIGMADGPEQDRLAFQPDLIAGVSTVFDVVARPAETPLIRAARAAGRPVITGAEVITLQALEQFVLYTGVRPDPGLVQQAAALALAP
ncbi:shikimate 5-dehydrogenase [Deinococcus sonorensis]|uniref:Shikimate 5-dehydrogenase n=2 Tax=Deinococcus sonorensis TaxID=309891 RepID=A0AAU7UAK2_9DEIO